MKKMLLSAIGAAMVMVVAQAMAKSYPSGPVTMIVPFAAGGPTDTLARALADEMGKRLGERVIVVNKPGAGGNVGSALAARAQPDGQTVLIATNGPLVANPMLFKDISFNPDKDFAPISLVTYLPNMLAVHPSVPANTVEELTALLRANPGKYSFASGGLGTSSHFAGELYKSMTGVDMSHVPYKGDGASMTDVVGGQVPIVFGSVFATSKFVEMGRLKGLAVTSIERVPSVPDVQTIDETGLKGYDLAAWYGLVAPVGTPEPIIEQLSATVAEIVADPDFKKRVKAMGGIPRSMQPEEFVAFIKAERPKWERLIKESKIEIN